MLREENFNKKPQSKFGQGNPDTDMIGFYYYDIPYDFLK